MNEGSNRHSSAGLDRLSRTDSTNFCDQDYDCTFVDEKHRNIVVGENDNYDCPYQSIKPYSVRAVVYTDAVKALLPLPDAGARATSREEGCKTLLVLLET